MKIEKLQLNQLKLLETKAKSLNHHKTDLDKFKYDENCEFCIKNGEEQINEQDEIKTQMYHLDDEWQSLEKKLNIKSTNLENISDAEEKKEELERFHDELTQIQHDAVKIGGKIDSSKAKVEHFNSNIVNIESKITKYYKLEEKIEKNKTINEKISILTEKISNLNFSSIEIDKNYKKIISTLSIAKNQKENIEQDIQNLVEVEQKILDLSLIHI